VNNEALDQGWQDLQSRIEKLHAKYFGEYFHKVEFKFPDEQDIVVTAKFEEDYN